MKILVSNIEFIFILHALLMLPGVNSFAQTSEGVFDNSVLKVYNQQNGLPQNSINNYCFDNYGYLWLGTMSGLSRFDGKNFKNQFGPKGEISPRVRVIQFAKKSVDTIYAATADLMIFVIANGDVISFEPYSVNKHGIILRNSQSTVPVFTSVSDAKFHDYCISRQWATQFYNLGFSYGKDSFAVFGMNNVLSLFTHKGLFKSLPLPWYSPKNDYLGWPIFVLEKNIIKLNEKANSLDVFALDGSIKHVPVPGAEAGAWQLSCGKQAHSLFLRNKGKLFEIRCQGGDDKLTFFKIMDNFKDTIDVVSMENIDNKYFIVATSTDGLHVFYKNSIKTFTGPKKDFDQHYFYAQALMPDNKSVLTGMNLLFDKKGFKSEISALDPNKVEQGSIENLNRAIFKDSKGFYWFTRYVPLPKLFEIMKGKYPGATDAVKIRIINSAVRCFYEDHSGNIWCSCDSKFGYFKGGTSNYFTVLKGYVQGDNVAKNIECIIEGNDGTVLMGTTNGLYKLDTLHPSRFCKKYLVDNGDIRFLNFNKQTGAFWIGTYGKGMWILKKSGSFIQLPMDNEKNMSIVHYAVTDQKNRVWFSTNAGLYVTSKKDIDEFEKDTTVTPFYYRFYTNMGAGEDEFNGGCQLPMILHPDGTLTISSVAGLVWLNTNEVPIEFPNRTLQISLMHGDKLLSPGITTLDIAAGDNRPVLVSVQAPYWGADCNLQLQFRLIKKGIGDQEPRWQEVNEKQQIPLGYLSAGQYIIQLKKRVGLNSNEFITQTVNINKNKLWYQTIILYPVLFLFFLVAGNIAYRWRIDALRKKNTNLKKAIGNATTQLQQKNEELKKTVNARNSLILLFNHDLSTPLFFINRLALSLANSRQLNESQLARIKILSQSTQDLEELMNDMLLWIQLQRESTSINLENEPCFLIDVLEGLIEQFHFRLEQNKVTVRLMVSEETIISTDSRILSSILYNLLISVIKRTEEGVIQIEQQEKDIYDDGFSIAIKSRSNSKFISDTLAANNYREINQMTKYDSVKAAEQDSQIGLQLIANFSALLGIAILIDDRVEANDTTIKIEGLKLLQHKSVV